MRKSFLRPIAATILFGCTLQPCALAREDEKRGNLIGVQEAFNRMRRGATPEEVGKARLELVSHCALAVYFLAKQLDNAAEAADTFLKTEHARRDDSGKVIGWNQPTMGDVALYLIQEMIEGPVPGAYRRFFVLKRDTAAQWLSERPNLTLKDLRIAVAEEEYREALRVETKYPGKVPKKTIEFLEKRLLERKSAGGEISKNDGDGQRK